MAEKEVPQLEIVVQVTQQIADLACGKKGADKQDLANLVQRLLEREMDANSEDLVAKLQRLRAELERLKVRTTSGP